MSRLTPTQAMQMAIEEAKKGAGFVSPNPLVGCVILDEKSNLIGAGHHARLGGDHAEIAALKTVKDPSTLKGAQVFVTLEPCAHQGRTPSCAKALAKLPIRSVTYGLIDPNPKVAGQGAVILREAGIAVTVFPDLQDQLEELAEIFLTNMRERRAYLAMKVASSLDGKIARADGTSKWITGEESRAHVQYLRGCHDAVLVGAGTFLSDDPALNARDPRFEDKPQRAILLDPEGKTFSRLKGSRLLSVRAPENLTVVTRAALPEGLNVRSLEVPMENGEFSWAALLRELPKLDIHSVFVEGGAATYTSCLRQGLVDRLYLFFAPILIGEGLSWFHGAGDASLSAGPRLAQVKSRFFGDDVLVTGRMKGRT